MECFYINLDDATNRRDCIESNFFTHKAFGWNLTRVPAIDKQYVEDNAIKGTLTSGEKGCFLSHKKTIVQSLNNDENILILEDDAIIGEKTCSSIEVLIQEMYEKNIEWDILFSDIGIHFASRVGFFVEHRRQFDTIPELKIFNLENIIFTCATAYIINGKSKQKIASLLDFEILDTPIDSLYNNLIKEKKIKAYIAFPFPTSVSDFANISTINDQKIDLGTMIFYNFRKMLWIDRNLEQTQETLDQINATLVNVPYEKSETVFNYTYQLNKIKKQDVNIDGVNYEQAKSFDNMIHQWFDMPANKIEPELIIPIPIKL